MSRGSVKASSLLLVTSLTIGCAPTGEMNGGGDPAALYTADDVAFERDVRAAEPSRSRDFLAEQDFVTRAMADQPPVLMQLRSLTPLPNECYTARFTVRPTVPIRVWHTSDARDDVLALVRPRVHADAGFIDPWIHEWRDDDERSTAVLPPETREVSATVVASSDDREFVHIGTPFGLFSAPFAIDRGSDRAAGRFEQARRDANKQLVDELRARGFAGAVLDAAAPVQALTRRLDALARRHGMGCADPLDLETLAAEALSSYVRLGTLAISLVYECDDEDVRIELEIWPRLPASAVASPTWEIEHAVDVWDVSFSVGEDIILDYYYANFELDEAPESPPTPAVHALRRELQRRVLQPLVGGRVSSSPART